MAAPFFSLEMLPARHGDSLWIEYGTGENVHRILIDGGPVNTFESILRRISAVHIRKCIFELIVLSHVDSDHIEGLVRLFAEDPLPFAVKKIWFNGWRQMTQGHRVLGPMQGEFLSTLLANRTPKAWKSNSRPWVIPNRGKLPTYKLKGGMKLTLLSPDRASLAAMAKAWRSQIEKAGLTPGDLDAAWKVLASRKKFLPRKGLLAKVPDVASLVKRYFLKDQAVPNGSSIAFLAEYKGRSALLLADAHPDLVANSVQRLCKERGVDRLEVDAVKLAHHGSSKNTSIPLLKLIRSRSYLISTNGDHFSHPDREGIARVLESGRPARLYFNYKTKFTKPWLTKAAQSKYKYRAIAPDTRDSILRISL